MKFNEVLKRTGTAALSVTLAFSLMAGSGMIAYANATGATSTTNYTIDTNQNASLTIHKYDQNANGTNAGKPGTGKEDTAVQGTSGKPVAGATFSYLKVADIETVTEAGKVVILYKVEPGLQTALDLRDEDTYGYDAATPAVTHANQFTADKLNSVITGTDGVLSNNQKSALEKYMASATGVQTMTTDDNGKATKDSLPLGLYLVVETAIPSSVTTTTNPFFVSLPMTDSVTGATDTWNYDVHVYPKNQVDVPTIDKVVKDSNNTKTNTTSYETTDYLDTTTASKGDTLNYAIAVKIPEVNDAGESNANNYTTFLVQDTLADGLKGFCNVKAYIADSNITTADGKKTLPTKVEDITDYTVVGGSTTATDNSDSQTLTVALKGEALEKLDETTNGYAGKYLIITYDAIVTNTAVLGDSGNENSANLYFNRENMDKNNDGKPDGKPTDTAGDGIPDAWEDNPTTPTSVTPNKKNPLNSGSYDNDVITGVPSIEDEAKVYTYEIDLTKILEADGTDFANVKFTLYNEDEGYYVIGEQSGTPATYNVKTRPTNESGTYTDTEAPALKNGDVANGADKGIFTVVNVSNEGKLNISGLEAGTYTLTEVQTAQGYSLLKDPIKIVITPTSQVITASTFNYADGAYTATDDGKAKLGNTTPATAKVDTNDVNMTASGTGDDASENAIVPIQVTNVKGFTLPQTGGAGSIVFTVLGAVVVGGAVVIIRKGKKKEN